MPALVRALAIACSPLSMPAAAATLAAPTLVRLEVAPYDAEAPFAASLNHCVSLIVARDYGAAAGACDAALSVARLEATDPGSLLSKTGIRDTNLAIAYNDRAVLHLRSGALGPARADIRRALRADPSPAVEATAHAIDAADRAMPRTD